MGFEKHILMTHHDESDPCPRCTELLAMAHGTIAAWFLTIKKKYPDMHVAKSYRGRDEQEEDYRLGESKEHFPNSRHNTVDPFYGNPCSQALDLFQQVNGQYELNESIMRMIDSNNKYDGLPFTWGGNFRDLHDTDHFEMSGPKA